MRNTLVDIEKKLDTTNPVDEIESAAQKRGRQFWLIVPPALLAVAGCAFLVVRRIRGR